MPAWQPVAASARTCRISCLAWWLLDQGGRSRCSVIHTRCARWVGRASRTYKYSAARRRTTRSPNRWSCRSAVAPLGVDESWFCARTSASERPLADPYLVYVGNWKRHKNIPALLRAFSRVLDRIPHRLVLIGRSEGLNADPAIDRELSAL